MSDFRKLYTHAELREAYVIGYNQGRTDPSLESYNEADRWIDKRFKREDVPDTVMNILETVCFLAGTYVREKAATPSIGEDVRKKMLAAAIAFEERHQNDWDEGNYGGMVQTLYESTFESPSPILIMERLTAQLTSIITDYLVSQTSNLIITPSPPLRYDEDRYVVSISDGFLHLVSALNTNSAIHCRNQDVPIDVLIKLAKYVHQRTTLRTQQTNTTTCETPPF